MTIQSEDTQEIICTNCGRPNLPEAVKCWYCQTELTSSEEPAQLPGEAALLAEARAEQTAAAVESASEDPAANEDENIPEWLQRIREKERKERASQDARDQWQQQALFNGSSGPRPAPAQQHEPVKARPQKEKQQPAKPVEPETPPVDEEPVEQPALAPAQPQPNKPEVPEIIAEEDVIPSDESINDLPEGFIKFDSNNNSK